LRALNLDVEQTERCIEANRHNNETTTYYLLFKRFLRQGNISKADFSGKHFDKAAIEPNRRRERKHSLRPEELMKRSGSPSDKKLKAKSFYKENREKVHNESFLERSLRIQKNQSRKRVRAKSQNKSRSKVRERGALCDRVEEQESKDRKHSLNKVPHL
jgi:hypothetical protein